jgi:hypothetical protein
MNLREQYKAESNLIGILDWCEYAVWLEDKASALQQDAERMDWLVSMYVEVRTPLLYGSRALFVAQTESDEEDAEHRTNLREEIDARRAQHARKAEGVTDEPA